MEETLRVLVALALGLLLVLLRLDAERFGVAEYLGATSGPARSIVGRRFAWYGLGLALVLGIGFVHPDAPGQLSLGLGDAGTALLAGLAIGAVGVSQAVLVGLLRHLDLRPADARAYPREVLDAVATAFVDEFAFRGILLGYMLSAGLDPLVAVLVETLAYGLATRTGAPGRDPYLLGVALGIGLLGGWATVATGAVGAAFLGHAITRFAVYVFVRRGDPDRWVGERVEEGSSVPPADPAPDAWHAASAPEPRVTRR